VIKELGIFGFKRFHNQIFSLAPLTILAGLNGSGKTSFLHALILAHEASSHLPRGVVRLNGPFGIELGTFGDVRNWQSESLQSPNMIRLSLKTSDLSTTWTLTAPSDESMYLEIEADSERPMSPFSLEPRSFSYICAERLGPRSALKAAGLPPAEFEVGVQGENCAQILAALGNKPLENTDRAHPKTTASSSFLKYEVEHWLAEVARPIEIDAVQYPESNMTALRFRSATGEIVRATNMGFGVSYALPIILAGLIAQPGGQLIVENPEAHLHPAGQSNMGVFLAWLSGHGVQVIVETHSDHVLNGIRRAIAELMYIDPEAALVQFFESGEQEEPQIHELHFTALGGMSHWPRGFFDQYQIDVSSLGRIRRRS
jgi:predicted ATPase